jgi:hypothetical protein
MLPHGTGKAEGGASGTVSTEAAPALRKHLVDAAQQLGELGGGGGEVRCVRRRDGDPEPPPRRQRDDHGHRAHGEAPRDGAHPVSTGAIARVHPVPVPVLPVLRPQSQAAPRPPCPAPSARGSVPSGRGNDPAACDLRLAPCSRRAAPQCATVRSAPAPCRGGPSSAKSGRNPALSRNGEAPEWGRAQPPDLGRRNQSSEEGRFVRCPSGVGSGALRPPHTDGG